MKIFIKHILKNLSDNKKRTISVMFSLIVTTMLFTIVTMFCLAFFNMMDSLEKYEEQSIVLVSKTNENIKLEDAKKIMDSLETDYDINTNFYANGYILKDNEYKNLDYIWGIYDIKTAKDFNYISTDFNSLKDDEVIINDTVADNYKIKVNDEIKVVNRLNEEISLKVVGIEKLKNISKSTAIFAIYTNLNTFKRIESEFKIYKYDFKIKDSNFKLTDEKLEKLEEIATEYGVMNYESYNNDDALEQLKSIIYVLAGFGAVMLVLVYITNSTLSRIIINERIPVAGSFRSVGFTAKEIKKVMILEMILYGLIASLIGYFLGYFITSKLMHVLSNSIIGNDMVYSVLMIPVKRYSILLFIFIIIFFCLFQLFVSYSEIRKSSKLSIKDCIFNKNDNIYVFKINDLFISIFTFILVLIILIFDLDNSIIISLLNIVLICVSAWFIVPYLVRFIAKKIRFKNIIKDMALNNIANGKLQISLVRVLTIFLFMIIYVINMSVDEWADSLDTAEKFTPDIVLTNSSYSDTTAKLIENYEEVEKISIEKTYYMSMTVKFAEIDPGLISFSYHNIYNADVYAKVNDIYKNIDYESINNLKENEVAITKEMAEDYSLSKGDYVNISFTYREQYIEKTVPIYVKIAAVVDIGIYENNIYLSKELASKFEMLNIAKPSITCYVFLKDKADVNKVIDKINKDKTVSDNVFNLEEYKDEFITDVMEMSYMYVGIAIFIIILGIFVLANIQKVNFSLRKKEFASLYSICLSRKQIIKLVKYEFLYSYIIAVILAIIISLIEYFSIVLMIVSIILSVIIYILLKMALRNIKKNIKKFNVIDEIKYE